MSLSLGVKRKLLRCLRSECAYDSIEMNLLLWSLDSEGFSEACQLAEKHRVPILKDLISRHKVIRQKWPDPQAALKSLENVCKQFPLASRPLLQGGQAEIYALLDFAEWVNADPEFVLMIIDGIWQQTTQSGDKGYARLIYKKGEHKNWSDKPSRNKCCYIAASMATYTQYSPSTFRRVYLAGMHSSAGGLYNFRRRSNEHNDTDAGQFAFFGLTDEAREAARERQSELSDRIYNGGWE